MSSAVPDTAAIELREEGRIMKISVGAVAVLLLVSCGGDDKSTSGGPLALAQMPAELKKTICEKIYSCCSPAERMDNPEIGQDVASCVAELNGETTFLLADITLSVTEGRVTYHGDKMAKCLADFKARSCDQVKMPAGDVGITEMCAGAFEPKVPVGGACSDYWDCMGGWCAGDIGGLNDVCTPRGAEGAECDEGPECQSSLCNNANMCIQRPAGSGNLCRIGLTYQGQHIGHDPT
jgi:hypothetical protein